MITLLDNVLSPFNPIVSLKPEMAKKVNEEFILGILEEFFKDKGTLSNFSKLDAHKLMTEIEFEKKENFVKEYIYKELIDEISKKDKYNKIEFKPKYVITFDKDLASYNKDKIEEKIKYGVIFLGEAPILYYILIDLQELIQFIKGIKI